MTQMKLVRRKRDQPLRGPLASKGTLHERARDQLFLEQSPDKTNLYIIEI